MRYGTIGTSWITDDFIHGAAYTGDMELAAVYSREKEKGKSFAQKHGKVSLFNDLKEMAESNLIEAVYIASPNVFHYPQSKLFLSHGKHVLCEKPLCVTSEQILELQALADERNIIYMEALMALYMPQRKKLKEALGRIGKVRSARLDFSQLSSKYEQLQRGEHPNIFKPGLAAGCLMDIGVYCVYAAIDWFGIPQEVTATAGFLPGGADGFGFSIFIYADKQLCLSYSKVGQGHTGSEIAGEKGTICIDSVSQLRQIQIKWNDGTVEWIHKEEAGVPSMSHEAKGFFCYVQEPQVYRAEYRYASDLAVAVSRTMEKIRKKCGISLKTLP